MIFLSVITQAVEVAGYSKKRKSGQFHHEYGWLLKSIYKTYPEAIPVLYVLEGSVDVETLKGFHPNLTVVDYTNRYKRELGIDIHKLKAVREAYQQYGDNVLLSDTDCIVSKRFDDFLETTADVTFIKRGKVMWLNHRQDVCFGVSLYHNNNSSAVVAFIDDFIQRGTQAGRRRGDWWNNCQPICTEYCLEVGEYMLGDKTDIQQGVVNIGGQDVVIRAVPQGYLGDSFNHKTEQPHPDSRILHYKQRKLPVDEIYKRWGP